jgi:signal peptidase II
MLFRINKKTAVYIYLAVLLLLIDRLLKTFIWFNQDFEYKIIGEYFKISFALNPYIAFSLPLSGYILVLIIILILILLILTFLKLYKTADYHSAGLFLLVFIGASSNLFDRLKYSAVIDYFDLKYFTVFNLADSMIVVSAFILLIVFSRR